MNSNPWRCLAAYSEPKAGDKNTFDFCGRDKEIRELTGLIENNLCVTLYGQTGIGKTSLLNAGVFPLLRKNDYIPLTVRFEMINEADKSFAEIITEVIESPETGLTIIKTAEASPYITNDEQKEPNINYLWEYFASRHFYKGETEVFPVVVLDQFEENLIKNRAKSEILLQQIYSLIDDNKIFPSGFHNETNFRFVISIREDELFRLEEIIDRYGFNELKNNRYRLTHLSHSNAAEVICKPGRHLMPENDDERAILVDQIIELARDKESDNISTLLLSLVCSCLYDRSKGTAFTSKDIESLGNNILADFYKSLKIDNNTRHEIESKLIDSTGRRKIVNTSELDISPEKIKELCSGDKRILQHSNDRVELVHDLLAEAVRETKLSRIKSNRSTIFKASVIVFFCLLFIIALLGFIYSIHGDGKKMPLFPEPEATVNNLNAKYLKYSETITYDGDESGLHLNDYPNLRQLIIEKPVHGLSIRNCPNLNKISLNTDSLIRLSIYNCPNLQFVPVTETIKVIESDSKIQPITFGNPKLLFQDGTLWNLETKEIIYSDYATIGKTGERIKIDFPVQLQSEDSIIPHNYKKFVNSANYKTIDNKYIINTVSGELVELLPDTRNIDLSGIKVKENAFLKCPVIDTLIFDDKTEFETCWFKVPFFRGIQSLKVVIYRQTDTENYTNLEHLIAKIPYLENPIEFIIEGTKNVEKRADGIVYKGEIPIVISSESNSNIAIYAEDSSDEKITHLAGKSWKIEILQDGNFKNSINAYSYNVHPEDISDSEEIRYNNSYLTGAQLKSYSISDSFVEGDLSHDVFCQSLTKKDRFIRLIRGFVNFYNLEDSVASGITLEVPYGTLEKALRDSDYSGFKEIKERSLPKTLLILAQILVVSIIGWCQAYVFQTILIALFFLIVFIVVWYLSYQELRYDPNKRTKRIGLKSFMTAVSVVFTAFIVWVSVYWFCFLWIFAPDNIIPATIAFVITIVIVWLIHKNVLFAARGITKKTIKEDCRNLWNHAKEAPQKLRAKISKKVIVVAAIILGFGTAVCIVTYNYMKRVSETKELYAKAKAELAESPWSNRMAVLYALTTKAQNRLPDIAARDSIYDLIDSLAYTTSMINNILVTDGSDIRNYVLSQDGKRLLTYDYNNKLKLWDTERKIVKDSVDFNYVAYMFCMNDSTFIINGGGKLYSLDTEDTDLKNSVDTHYRTPVRAGNKLYYREYNYSIISVSLNGYEFVCDTIDIDNNGYFELYGFGDQIIIHRNDSVIAYNPENNTMQPIFTTAKSLRDVAYGSDSESAFITEDSIYFVSFGKNPSVKADSIERYSIDEIAYIPGSNRLIGVDNNIFEIKNCVTKDLRKRKAIGNGYDLSISPDGKFGYARDWHHIYKIHFDNASRQQVILDNFRKQNYELPEHYREFFGLKADEEVRADGGQ